MSIIKFSIVIPLYNKEQSIFNTVFSALNQTYQNFEIVIINDGSTDDSVNVVNSIKDKRIRLIHQENRGVSAARNRGIKEAKYEWIAYLDGDDIWEANHLEEVVNMMKVFPKEWVYVTSFIFSDNREMFKHKRNGSIFKIENYFKEALKEYLLWTSIVVIHSECIRNVGGFNENLKYGEDLDLWARVAKDYRIIKSSNVTATYRVDAENRSSGYQNLNHCFDYQINLNDVKRKDIYDFYCLLINRRLFSYLISLNIKDFIKLKRRHKFTGFYRFFFLKLKNKFM